MSLRRKKNFYSIPNLKMNEKEIETIMSTRGAGIPVVDQHPFKINNSTAKRVNS